MKKFTKLSATALSIATISTVVPLSLVGTATAQDVTDGGECSAVELIVMAGTGESSSTDDPNDIFGLASGINYTANMDNKYGDQVSAWQTPYASSVGIVGTLGETRADQTLPYGASRVQGTEAAIDRMEEVAVSCPDTKFMISGFSQGATVAGDVVEAVSQGRVAGVESDDILAAYLLADPGRAQMTQEQVTTSTGATGFKTVNGAVLVPLDQSIPNSTSVGLTGPRSAGAFDSYSDNIMSFCHPNDAACSAEPGDILQQVGQTMNEWTVPSNDHILASPDGLKGVDVMGTMGIFLPHIIRSLADGDDTSVISTMNLVARNPSLNTSQKAAMRALGQELAVIARAVKNYDGPVPVYTGSNLVGNNELTNIALGIISIGDNKKLANLAPYLMNMMPHHLSYFEGSEHGPWTIGGKTVDSWIQDDVDARLATYLETLEATPVDDQTVIPEEPTTEPTEEPTTEPTVDPTEEPTTEPTEDPTTEPTEETTTEPTEEPTTEPTEEPTTETTEEPTTEPTVDPTGEPTTEPTPEPTVDPTEEPTTEPTPEPTVDPTEEPTVDPTEEPTKTPEKDEGPRVNTGGKTIVTNILNWVKGLFRW